MRSSFLTVSSILAVVSTASAFPQFAKKAACPFGYDTRDLSLDDLRKSGIVDRDEVQSAEKRDLIGSIFQPLSGILQAIDIPTPQPQGLTLIPAEGDDAHKFIAPGPTDVRGLCPTLNAMANHGYLDRSGITTFAEAANAQQTVFGFGLDISAVLSLLGLIAGGDLISGKYSIGGYDARVPATLGKAYGIDAHGRFEVDGSISRGDTYFGDNHSFNKSRWDELVSFANDENQGLFDSAAGHADRSAKYQESKATNPQFIAGPVYLAVSAATRAFLYRGLSNGTTENQANYANVSPWYLQEKIPDQWYRRGTTYYLADFLEDVLDYAVNSPIELGQNQGLDNFVPLDASIPQAPEELLCFLFSQVLTVTPQQGAGDVIGQLGTVLTEIVSQIITPLIGSAGYKCDLKPQFVNQGTGSGIGNSTSSNATST